MFFSSKNRVALLGVGSMGTALARILAKAGHPITVWNRNLGRAIALQPLCAVAETATDACRSADLILTCFSSFDVTLSILKQSDVTHSLAGKTLVQMSTATQEQVETLQLYCQSNGIDFLDAKIAVTPLQIGEEQSVIFLAGPQDVYGRFEHVFKALAGRATYMGERIDAAVLGDFAFLSIYFAGTIGVLHGAAFAKASGLKVEQFFDLVPSFLHEISARSKSFKTLMLAEEYSDVQSALKTDLAAARLMANAVKQSNMSTSFVQSLIDLMNESVSQGLGDLDSAAMVQTFIKRT